MRLVFDIETDGLLNTLTRIHCLVIYDIDSQRIFNCKSLKNTISDGKYLSIEAGISMLSEADEIAGHNIVKFDIPAIQKLFPDFKPKNKIFDTLLVSKLVYPDIGEIDDRNVRKNKFPKKLRGRYSLKAWGYRLGELKGEYCEQDDCWLEWSQEMQNYCEQDVMVTKRLYELLKAKGCSEEAIKLEHQFAGIIFQQEQRGVSFDKEKAIELAGMLIQEKTRLEGELRAAFPNEIIEEVFIPEVNNKSKGYIKGQPFIKKKVIEFKPSSRQMIIDRLIKKYKWKPKKLTKAGNYKLDEEVIEGLPYKEAPLILDYLITDKILGYVVNGKNAWLKTERNSVIHGELDTLGAVTRRCTHKIIANVPAISKDKDGNTLLGVKGKYGKECRELFIPRKGFTLVGCDASGLELRMLAHYMNDPDYTNEILNGDIHSTNQKAAGLPTRNNAKTFIYGFLYGAGDAKIGSIIGKGAKEGKLIKTKFLTSLPKLKKLSDGVKQRITSKGYLKSIDGGKLKVRGAYKGLNVLLQSAGAIVMKKALCILSDDLQSKGWKLNEDYAFVLNVHDEYQVEVKPELVNEYTALAVNAIRKAGEYFGLRCPLDGEVKAGNNWAETH